MALSKDVQRIYEKGDRNAFPIKASTKFYEGSAIGVEVATGYARPLVAGDLFSGFAEGPVDNSSGSNGDLSIRARDDEKVLLAVSGAAITDIGKPVYASDDDTFTLTATSNSYVGRIYRFDSTGKVWVTVEKCCGGSLTDLTAATGTASTTISDVGAAFSQSTLNNNFKSLADRINAISAMLK